MLRLFGFIRTKFKELFGKQKLDLNLGGVKIDAEQIKSDFEVLDRYQNFSSEMLRLSLLGIGALAFLLKEVFATSKPDEVNRYINLILTTPNIKSLVSISIVLFAIAAACALCHRYYSSDSMAYHIRYLRLKELAKTSPPPPNLQEVEKETASEKERRDSSLVFGGVLIACSAIFLGLGAILLAIALQATLS